MATTALGPTLAGGLQPIVKNGYELIYYPDVNNDALQAENKPPVFYWLPNYVHLARKDGREDGDLMFNMIRFAGVTSGETNVGVGDTTEEVAGGVLSFTITSAPPDNVLLQGQEAIIQMFQGKQDFFWGIRSSQRPIFRPVVIVSNITAVSNLSPAADGSIPTPPQTNATAGAPAANNNGAGATPPTRSLARRLVPEMVTQRDFTVRDFGKKRDANLGLWYWNMQGQGNGSVDPMGQNAYTALVGSYPSNLLWASFHGSYSPVFVQQALKVKFWVPAIEITLKGNWDKIYNHFSAATQARYAWFSVDLQAEFNSMKTNGTLEVDVKIDTTLPDADKISKYVEEKTNLVFEKFMEQAKKMIFDVPQPNTEAAKASTGSAGLWGVGLALKYRRDETHLELYYHEKRQMSYLQDHVISSAMQGLEEEIEADPTVERKYFQTVYMDDWPRKLGRIIKPIANWASDPIAFMSVQVGYPNTKGELMWTGRTFQKTDPDSASWSFGMTQKMIADVQPPPAGWKSDMTFVKRRVHMMEPPDPALNPFVRVHIKENEIDVDAGENGVCLNDVTLEVRADDAGKLRLGPISLNVDLENEKQIVEVTFRLTEESGAQVPGYDPIKFAWKYGDQTEPRFWSVFTSDASIRPFYEYQVRVIVKGSLFTKGMEWESPWTRSLGNGPLMISVPTTEDEGVVIKREYVRPASAQIPASTERPTTGSLAPPRGKPAVKREVDTEDANIFTEFTKRSFTNLDAPAPPSRRSPAAPPPLKRRAAPPVVHSNGSGSFDEISVYKEI